MKAARRSRGRTAVRSILAVALLVAAVGGCAGEQSAAPAREIAAARLSTADVVAGPLASDTVLVLHGAKMTNALGDSGPELRLTMADLDRMRTVEAEVYEPFLKRRVTFRGVPFEDLVAFAGMPANATTLATVALNEYAVDIPASVTRTPGMILATSMDGAGIPVDDAGPIRIVFTDGHPDARNESYWNWSLASVTIRTGA